MKINIYIYIYIPRDRGTSLISKRPPPRTTIGPKEWGYCRVLGRGVFL